MTSFNQIDDYGQEKLWKTQKQLAPRKRKNQIAALVEILSSSVNRKMSGVGGDVSIAICSVCLALFTGCKMSGVLAMLALQCSLKRASAQPASVGAVAVEHCGISGSYLQIRAAVILLEQL
ncbi:DExH-box ATP-dependent RNA helicase DExH5, mitochondrial [Glycine soja]